MSEVLECTSCGGTNQLPVGKTSMFCAFCGNAIEKIILNVDRKGELVSRIKTKPKISKKRKELKITGKEIESLKEIIDWFTDSELQSIKYLDLSDNNLSDLSDLVKFKNAEIIDLSNNKISELNFIGAFKSLQVLNLSNNIIVDVRGLFINKEIFDSTSRTNQTFKNVRIFSDVYIYMENNRISNISNDAIRHLKELLFLNNVELKLNSNPIFHEKLDLKQFDSLNSTISAEELVKSGKSLFLTASKYLKESFEDQSFNYSKAFNEWMADYAGGNIHSFIRIYNQNAENNEFAHLSLKYPPITEFKKALKMKTGYDPNNVKSGMCFIATVTMGSYDHPQVMELRNFRDEWILTKSWGESFVNWYYHYGEKAAKLIDKSFALKKVSYLIIVKPLVYLSRIVRK